MTLPMAWRTWAEIDLSAIRENTRRVREAIGGRPEILAVVKANAYGHGAAEVARAIAGDVSYFGVACIEEAAAVCGLGRDILLLSPCLPGERAAAAAHIVTVSSAAEAAAFPAPVRINFKIDTGMGRIGCTANQAAAELAAIAKMPGITIHSISSHLPASDEDADFTRAQLARFASLREALSPLAPVAKWHVLNSAGIFGFPGEAADIVRAGLALYGSAYPPAFQDRLRPALTWKSRIVFKKTLTAGSCVSYGRTVRLGRDTLVASVAVGYADGFPRQASGNGVQVLCCGRRCDILGRITMDQIMVDISTCPQADLGEEVVLIGSQGRESIAARELAEKSGTIAWHLFTGLAGRVHRIHTS